MYPVIAGAARCIRVLTFAALAMAAAIPCAYADQSQAPRAMPQRASTSAGAVGQVGPVHRFFGLLASAAGAMLTVRLRNGRLLHVDATQAIALNRISAPYYPGKPTVVTGTFGRNGVFNASAVARAAPQSMSWGPDQ